MADRNFEELRNGRRSRGPSPNGHLSDDSSATDESEQGNFGIYYKISFECLDWRSMPTEILYKK